MRTPKVRLESSTELIREPRYLSQTIYIVSLGFIPSIFDHDVLTQDLNPWITEVRTYQNNLNHSFTLKLCLEAESGRTKVAFIDKLAVTISLHE